MKLIPGSHVFPQGKRWFSIREAAVRFVPQCSSTKISQNLQKTDRCGEHQREHSLAEPGKIQSLCLNSLSISVASTNWLSISICLSATVFHCVKTSHFDFTFGRYPQSDAVISPASEFPNVSLIVYLSVYFYSILEAVQHVKSPIFWDTGDLQQYGCRNGVASRIWGTGQTSRRIWWTVATANYRIDRRSRWNHALLFPSLA